MANLNMYLDLWATQDFRVCWGIGVDTIRNFHLSFMQVSQANLCLQLPLNGESPCAGHK